MLEIVVSCKNDPQNGSSSSRRERAAIDKALAKMLKSCKASCKASKLRHIWINARVAYQSVG